MLTFLFARITSVVKSAVTKSFEKKAGEGRVIYFVPGRARKISYPRLHDMAISNFQIACAIAVVAIASFINLPAPNFSQRLKEWRKMGQYFNYEGNAIFYQG